MIRRRKDWQHPTMVTNFCDVSRATLAELCVHGTEFQSDSMPGSG